MELEFHKTEVLYYAVVFAVGTFSGFFRILRDGDDIGLLGSVSRSFASGVLSFGVIGLWIGHDAGSVSGPFYYLAAAALVGYLCKEQDKVMRWAIREALKRAGFIRGDKTESE